VVLFGTEVSLQQDRSHPVQELTRTAAYASTTINLRLAAVRRLAYEAADCGLLSADLAAGIRRVKGAKRLGMPVGNWLSAEQGQRLLRRVDITSIRGKRDYATVAILLGCGLRRAELTALRVEHIQQREEHWVIADLIGKGGHIRTIPMPDWVKAGIDAWMAPPGSRMAFCSGQSTKLVESGVAASARRSSGAW
jgi:site-specific recombinase XerC